MKRGLFSRLPAVPARVLLRRALAALAALCFAAWAAAGPLTRYLSERNPFFAGQALEDPRAQVRLWRLSALADPTKSPSNSIIATAREALRDNPSDSDALSAIAVYYSLRKDDRAAEFAFLADRITKRDRLSQVILAQEAASRGDTAEAMDRLATAIATSDRARPQIYAVLSQLSDRSDLRQALRPYVNDDIPWIREFLQFALRDGPDGPAHAADILLRADPAASSQLQQQIGGELLGFLVERQRFDLVRQLYPRVRGKKPDITRVVPFSESTIDPVFGWLAWHSAADASYGTEFSLDGDRVVPLVYATNQGGVALKRVLMLEPGRYELVERRSLFGGAKDGSAVWRLSCPGQDGMEPVWNGPSRSLVYSTAGEVPVVIPPKCDVQLLELVVSGARGGSGFELLIERFDLRRG